MLRVVIDANIFVGTILGGHISNKVCVALLGEKFKLIYSIELFNEIKHVLSRPEFEFNKLEIDKILTFIEFNGEFVEPVEKVSICRDSKDNPLLECALTGQVDYIVSGDKDLLSLHPFKNISIVSPRKFIELL